MIIFQRRQVAPSERTKHLAHAPHKQCGMRDGVRNGGVGR